MGAVKQRKFLRPLVEFFVPTPVMGCLNVETPFDSAQSLTEQCLKYNTVQWITWLGGR